jgi:hypothetical protein
MNPIYEISEPGDIRGLDTGKDFTGGERTTPTMADDAYEHFFRQALANTTFHFNDKMWLPVKIEGVNIKPIYEIAENGDVRKSNTCKLLAGYERISLVMTDGTYKRFSRQKLVDIMFHNDKAWRPIKINGLNIKPIYEIADNGDIRISGSLTPIVGKETIKLCMADGTCKHFLRKDIIDLTLNHKMWRMVKLDGFNIKPQYMISKKGDVHKLACDTNVHSKRGLRLMMEDGSHRRFYRYELVNAIFSDEKMETKLSQELDELCKRLELLFDERYSTHNVHIIRSPIVDNMIIIRSADMPPMSVTFESNGSRNIYVVRRGVYHDDTTYYGSENYCGSHTYFESDDMDIIVYHIDYVSNDRFNKGTSWFKFENYDNWRKLYEK